MQTIKQGVLIFCKRTTKKLNGQKPFFKDKLEEIYGPQETIKIIFEFMINTDRGFVVTKKLNHLLLYRRWPWHLLFWIGYIIFRFWPYYITIHFNYPPIFLQYMLLSELLFIGTTYLTLALYRRLFPGKQFAIYFSIGTITWIIYLLSRTMFQFWYLRNEPGFQNNTFTDIFFNNIAIALGFFYLLLPPNTLKTVSFPSNLKLRKTSNN